MSKKDVCDSCDMPENDELPVGSDWSLQVGNNVCIHINFTNKDKDKKIDICKECLYKIVIGMGDKFKAEKVVDRL